MSAATDFHEISSVIGVFDVDGRESKFEPGYVMGWAVDNIALGGGLESILEGVSKICDNQW